MANLLQMLGLQAQSPNPALYDFGQGVQAPAVGAPVPDFNQDLQPNQGSSSNILQSILNGPSANPIDGGQPQNFTQAPATGAPRERRSFLDTVGRISDVLANVGGAKPLYQPSIDARADRARMIDMEGLKKSLLGAQIGNANAETAQNNLKTQAAQTQMLGAAVNGLKAIGARSGVPGVLAAWPFMAKQMGIPDDKIAEIGQQLQADPEGTLAGLEAATHEPKPQGSEAKEVQVYKLLQGQDPELAKTYLQSLSDPHSLTPYQQAQLNTADRNFGLGLQRFDFEKEKFNRTEADKQNKKDKPTGDPVGALNLLSNIESGFNDLHNMRALPGDAPNPVSSIEGALGRSRLGQIVGEQTGSPAAQKRLELTKNINSLQSEMIKSLPGSATRTKFEQEIQKARLPDPMKMSYSTAKTVIGQLRAEYQRALKPGYAPDSGEGSTPLPAPAPGTIRNGFRYVGPQTKEGAKIRSNWVKVG